MQNPNHTKQGVGCQIDLLSLGRKPDDRCEDLTNVEATWHRPVFWLIAIGPITCEAFWSSVLYCARRNEGRDSRAFSMCLDLPWANNTVTVPEMVPCPNLTCQERNAKWAKENSCQKITGFLNTNWNSFYLRKRKCVPCFYRFIEIRVELWENEKCCGNTSRRRVFPQLFRVLPNFQECFYNTIETRRTCFLFHLENTATKKRKQLVNFNHQKVNSLCWRRHYINSAC